MASLTPLSKSILSEQNFKISRYGNTMGSIIEL